jgi:hypothetical protein
VAIVSVLAIGLRDIVLELLRGQLLLNAGEAGQAIGISTRFSGTTNFGSSAWIYDGTTTAKIGLMGSEYARNDGLMGAIPAQVNEVGQVIGRSNRHNGGSTYLGQDAWFYDSVRDQTFPLSLSTRSDGYAYSQAQYLGDDGLVLERVLKLPD